uniref:Uncharacterized protein n=1 Tax=Candidatus Methanophagaceae archaeon ANME-1 ERB6 TaxID=2759912 RepID=A0A7G9YZE2_9EURY|nr:hypothetical protein OJFPBHNK_00001 [Methanosarcinales archaeon ANME-1 ERB6]
MRLVNIGMSNTFTAAMMKIRYINHLTSAPKNPTVVKPDFLIVSPIAVLSTASSTPILSSTLDTTLPRIRPANNPTIRMIAATIILGKYPTVAPMAPAKLACIISIIFFFSPPSFFYCRFYVIAPYHRRPWHTSYNS